MVGSAINQLGSIDIRVHKVGEETFLYKIIRHVEEARALKPSIMIIVDKVLRYFVPGVLIFASGAFLFWTAGQLIITGSFNINRAVFAALAVLVMGYPCALGMAMPLALIWGGGQAAEGGILIRSGEAFQTFPSIRSIVSDKTGTITKGKPEVVKVIGYGEDRNTVLALTASAEMFSEHPLAKAILRCADKEKIEYQEPNEFIAYSGMGVTARVDQKLIYVGKPHFLQEQGIVLSEEELVSGKALSQKGQTVIAVGMNEKLIGIIGLADTLKEDVVETIKEIREHEIESIMITGDHRDTAESIAKQVGIEKYYSDVLPEQKAEKIRILQKDGIKVAVVGDGINDTPALMQADVGIAIGTVTDIAIESSDIVIIGQQTKKIMDAYRITKRSYTRTKQNLVLAFLFNGIGMPAATTGLIYPVWAMLAMVASVTAVLINSFGKNILPYNK